MRIVEITPDADFSTAVEIPALGRPPQYKSVANKGAGNGIKSKPTTPPKSAAMKAADHEITEANRMVLVIAPGSRRFVKLSEYQ